MTDAVEYIEERWDHLTTRYNVCDALHGEETPFQNMQIVETAMFGRTLVLDGYVQTTEKDEFIYHEMMTHVPILAHGAAESVLVIGGGDGGILREALRHESVQRAVMVEIDGRVVDFAKTHFPMICQDAFDDPRTEVVIADGAEYVHDSQEKYDVIIVDSSDPVGPAEVLFTQGFYANLARRLKPKGIMTRQTGSTFMQPEELPEGMRAARSVFAATGAYVFAVPTYVGGFFSSLFCSHDPSQGSPDSKTLAERFENAGLEGKTKYYSPGVHVGAFQLPPYVAERLT